MMQAWPHVHCCVFGSIEVYGGFGGGANDNTGDFRVRKMLEGLRRARPALPERCRSVTLQMQRGLLITFQGLVGSDYEASLFREALLVMFLGAFHSGELLAASRSRDVT